LRTDSTDIVALSALLTSTVPAIKNVIGSLKERGRIEEQVNVIVGAALSEQVIRDVLAGAYGMDVVAGTSTCVD
jgi:5-methyltetrahydrofolate--homocysteine methyltransferase